MMPSDKIANTNCLNSINRHDSITNCIDKAIDCSVWSGNWPFYYLRYGKLELLKERLTGYNITKAFVSPIEAILEQDTARANKNLLESIDNMKDEFFSPVPVIDLSYPNWEEAIEIASNSQNVKMIKLLPNYHIYSLDEDNLGKLVEYTMKYNLVISIQVRIEDARRQYPLMKVSDVDIIQDIKVLSYFPKQTFVISNGYLNEVEQVLYSLDNNVYVDISSAEKQDVLTYLCKKYGSERLIFSTHCGFYCPEGNIFKLAYSGLDEDSLERVAYSNAKNLLGAK
jgi:predicted TIM-barrel fold metal-dependent hydrolase